MVGSSAKRCSNASNRPSRIVITREIGSRFPSASKAERERLASDLTRGLSATGTVSSGSPAAIASVGRAENMTASISCALPPNRGEVSSGAASRNARSITPTAQDSIRSRSAPSSRPASSR